MFFVSNVVTHFQLLSVKKMGGAYVTYVDDADKGQRHVVTLVWSAELTDERLNQQLLT